MDKDKPNITFRTSPLLGFTGKREHDLRQPEDPVDDAAFFIDPDQRRRRRREKSMKF